MELEHTLHNNAPLPPENSGGLFSTLVVVLAALGIAGGLGFLHYQAMDLNKQIDGLNSKIQQQKDNIEKFKADNLDGLVEAERILSRAQKYRIEWSKIMGDVLALEKPGKITFLQFSSDRNKKVTISGRVSNWVVVQDLLKQIRENHDQYDYINDAFITSLARKEEKESNNTQNPYASAGSAEERSEFRLIFDYIQPNTKPSPQ